MATMLAPGDVKTYDQRVPRRVPRFPSGVFESPLAWARTLQLMAALAAGLLVFAGAHQYPSPCEADSAP